jgi:glucose-1-phosphate cytidylyltransferase
MQAVILAGGLGTRLSEETSIRPKPMVEIGGRPILWHIMKIYTSHGITDFIICLGYKGYIIKEYFVNYLLHVSDVTVDVIGKETIIHRHKSEPWRITMIDTGDDSGTGGRLKRISAHLNHDEPFCFTYGDGVGDVDISASIQFHQSHGKLATVTATPPPKRFGIMETEGDRLINFKEKPESDELVNCGFFVLSPKVIPYIKQDSDYWEAAPMEKLVAEDQFRVFNHKGFWQPMDTIRDKQILEELWASKKAPWKNWD